MVAIADPRTADTRELRELADACVVCGLCVPHCPTYRKTGLEAQSPRGRIQLMRAVLRDELEPTPRLHEHLDTCVGCRTCEAVCPNKVEYGRLIDGMRALHPPAVRQPRWYDRPLDLAVRHPAVWSLARQALALLQRTGGSGALRRLGLAPLPFGFTARATRTDQAPQVQLFLGCVSRLADAPALQAGVRLLEAAGIRVSIPPGQGCCGALAQHQGDSKRARQQAHANGGAFRADLPVLFAATGCGATLLDYPELGVATVDAQDLAAFLATHAADRFRLRPLPRTVWLQVPCSQRNVVRSVSATERLLRLIPELDVRLLPGNDQCCGAAGRYHLDQPAMAATLRDDKIAAMRATGATLVLTSNVGCALWLRAAVPDIELLHPLELLARQLET